MVFYFTLQSNPNVICYMGRDKYENEELIKWGWPEDFWFHVDDHSSAHVYVRLPQGGTIKDLTPEMIEECSQLTKANSIQGCKLNDIKVVYTPWANLKKTNSMEAGQVSFHDEKQRFYFTITRKNNAILNALEKTRVEKDNVDFRAEREARDDAARRKEKQELLEKREAEKQQEEANRMAYDLKHYTALNDETKMRTNTDGTVPAEDDFM